MEIEINGIKIGSRFRKDLGEIKLLEKSIDEIGLLHPIVVNENNELIAGKRRLEACKNLKWNEVPVTVINLDDLTRGEFDENTIRKDFLPSEIAAIVKMLRPIEEEKTEERRVSTLKRGIKIPVRETFPNGKGRARDKMATYAGVSGRTLEKIEEISDAAEQEPEKYQTLVDEMDRTGKVDGAFRKLKQHKDEEKILQGTEQRKISGKFKTILIDPPWDYEGLSLAGRGMPKYNVISLEELNNIDILKYADEEGCHLYLWTTNNFLYEALKLGEHWGFSYKTILTWVKPSIGLGSYFRNSTEHCLFFVYGKLRTRRNDIPTSFEARRTSHSEKPNELYEIIEKASYPPYLEIFARKERKGWAVTKGDIKNG